MHAIFIASCPQRMTVRGKSSKKLSEPRLDHSILPSLPSLTATTWDSNTQKNCQYCRMVKSLACSTGDHSLLMCQRAPSKLRYIHYSLLRAITSILTKRLRTWRLKEEWTAICNWTKMSPLLLWNGSSLAHGVLLLRCLVR